MSVGFTSFDEFWFQLIHHGLNLLAHRLPKRVRFSFGKPCQQLAQEHNLFLVHRNTICILQEFFHLRDVVRNFLPAMFPVYETGDVFHWPRAVKGVHGNQVFDLVRLKFPKVLFHSV